MTLCGDVGSMTPGQKEEKNGNHRVGKSENALIRGRTYCVNFQVGVPGSLSTIFTF